MWGFPIDRDSIWIGARLTGGLLMIGGVIFASYYIMGYLRNVIRQDIEKTKAKIRKTK